MPRHLRQTYTRQVGEMVNLQIPFQVRVCGDQGTSLGGDQGPSGVVRRAQEMSGSLWGSAWDPQMPPSCTLSKMRQLCCPCWEDWWGKLPAHSSRDPSMGWL